MSMVVSFCAVLFPRDVLDEILNLIESVSEGFPTYSNEITGHIAVNKHRKVRGLSNWQLMVRNRK